VSITNNFARQHLKRPNKFFCRMQTTVCSANYRVKLVLLAVFSLCWLDRWSFQRKSSSNRNKRLGRRHFYLTPI